MNKNNVNEHEGSCKYEGNRREDEGRGNHSWSQNPIPIFLYILLSANLPIPNLL